MDLTPEILSKLERLIAYGIQMVPAAAATRHFVFERDGYIALVEKRGDAFGSIGSAGILTEKGFAALVHRGMSAVFVAKDFEQVATEEQIQALRAFQQDLQRALSPSTPATN